ncbi:hypothetical protein K5D68_11460 [Pseudomonas cichorii]|nr:hypothetical protein [Pseudomonas cichorii]MBX8491541.1 hypothetical protein [Pseudomonas cichorii]MBX8519659.1 hypothetical protein [Pseudomonas cichorii]MBX8550203.1 hypothetical protein [Pseudomonas cichorii]
MPEYVNMDFPLIVSLALCMSSDAEGRLNGNYSFAGFGAGIHGAVVF